MRDRSSHPTRGLTLEDFDYDLPQSFIAARPAAPRDSSRLMVLDRAAQSVQHFTFGSLPSFLDEGDCVVLNDTKVMPCRLQAVRPETGGKVELLFVRRRSEGLWEALVRPGRKMKQGAQLALSGGGKTEFVERVSGSTFLFRVSEPFEEYMESWGEMPIPPYMKRRADVGDREDYQTVYARAAGSCAAPTAGLHFTKETFQKLEARGVETAKVLLHVGPGTFKPLEPGPIAGQTLDPEYFEVTAETCRVVNRTRGRGGRVFAIGTTTARTLETLADLAAGAGSPARGIQRSSAAPAESSAAGAAPGLVPAKGWAEKFIYPPYDFKVVDALITNFHLPGSSVMLLTCAFAGREFILSAYEEAKRTGYRFYSYGDSMLIV
jgi:S-adenosylmethionine:tRNA ribosyltransferase-isomerase